MLLCFVGSPENQAKSYLLLSDDYANQAEVTFEGNSQYLLKVSEDMALMALTYKPYDNKIWQKLSSVRMARQALIQSRQEQDLALSTLD